MTTTALVSERSGGVLIASPNRIWREQVLLSLEDLKAPVQEAQGGADALVKAETGEWQVLYLDRHLPDLDAEEVARTIRQRFPRIEVVLSDSENHNPISRLGQPCDSAYTLLEPDRERTEISPVPIEPLPGMVGSGRAMQEVYRIVRLIAPRSTTVLILGASGTGKELVARAIHELSPRRSRQFVVVNCAAIPETLLESELFGFSRGAFTGAATSYAGRVQAASGGTLFLDEVGDLPASLQAKLLRFLEQKEIQRLGSSETIRVDVRVVAATNADLLQKVEAGSFREDLYFRLSAFPVVLPALAEHLEDVGALAEHFLERLATEGRNPRCRLSALALRRLEGHAWRGNVRELQHAIERASILAEERGVILPEHLGLTDRFGIQLESDYLTASATAAAD